MAAPTGALPAPADLRVRDVPYRGTVTVELHFWHLDFPILFVSRYCVAHCRVVVIKIRAVLYYLNTDFNIFRTHFSRWNSTTNGAVDPEIARRRHARENQATFRSSIKIASNSGAL